MEDNLLTIALASDAKYMCLTAAAAWTALRNLSPRAGRVCVLLMTSGVRSGEIRAFERAIRSARPDVEFRVIGTHPAEVIEMAARTGAPAAQFLRLLVPDHVDADARRVIYLDSDVMVKDDLWKLLDEDLGGKVLGAVLDFNYPTMRRRRRSLSPAMSSLDCWRNLPLDAEYFNSGMMLIDVPQWGERGIKSILVDHILRHPKSIPLMDQDALVQCLHGQWHALPMRWNVQTIGRFHMPELSGWDQREIHGIGLGQIADHGVLHYNGSKPLRWGVSLSGRTRLTECELGRVLAASGYYSPVASQVRQLELHLRGVVRSVWLSFRRLIRWSGEDITVQGDLAPRIGITGPELSFSQNESVR